MNIFTRLIRLATNSKPLGDLVDKVKKWLVINPNEDDLWEYYESHVRLPIW